jgi:hypothetical protein
MAKLGKEILHFHQKYKDNPQIVRQHHRFLFDTTPAALGASSIDTQSAWLRSVKEAILVRKQYDINFANQQKANFKRFFTTRRGAPVHQK